jgi:hypothetical protein
MADARFIKVVEDRKKVTHVVKTSGVSVARRPFETAPYGFEQTQIASVNIDVHVAAPETVQSPGLPLSASTHVPP